LHSIYFDKGEGLNSEFAVFQTKTLLKDGLIFKVSLPSPASVYAIQDLSDAVNLGAPNRNIVMWPFKTTNMDESL